MYALYLDRLRCQVSIGIHPQELAAPQAINISLALALAEVPATDELAAALDYDAVREDVVSLASGRHFSLQETLCAQIIALCRDRPGVRAVLVQTEKPDIYPDVAAVGCRLAWLAEGVDRAEADFVLRRF